MKLLQKHLQTLTQEMRRKYAAAIEGTGTSWTDFEWSVREMLRWTNATAAGTTRFKAIRETVRLPDTASIHELLQENEFLLAQDQALSAYIRERAAFVTAAEKRFMEERGQYLDDESLQKAAEYRFTMFSRNAVADMLNIATQTQAADPEIAGLLPFMSYVTMKDERTRPTHRAMHGFMAQTHDPIWRVVRPSNGYNCRCTVRLYSLEEAKRAGWMKGETPRFSQKWPSILARKNYATGIFPDSGWHGPKFVAKL